MSKLCVICISDLETVIEVKDKLYELHNFIYVPNISKESLIDLIKSQQNCILYLNPNSLRFRINKDILLNNVICVCTCSTGTNHIDTEFCKEKNIHVIALTKDHQFLSGISATAELAFTITMCLIRNIYKSVTSVLNYEWESEKFVGRQVQGMTVGVIGYGRLGKMYAKYCNAFGMNVLVCDPYVSDCMYPKLSFYDVLNKSDIISFHVHLDNKTRHMFNMDSIESINSRGIYIVNTSRGDIVDESSIIFGLKTGKVLGYAADVVSNEMGEISESIIIQNMNNYNIIVTPHIGGCTRESMRMAYLHSLEKMKSWMQSVKSVGDFSCHVKL